MSQNGYRKPKDLLKEGCKISNLHIDAPQTENVYVILLCPDGEKEVVFAVDEEDGVKIAKCATDNIISNILKTQGLRI